MSRTVGVGIVGCGAVGAQVARILLNDSHALASRTGVQFAVRGILVRDGKKQRPGHVPSSLITTDAAKFLADRDAHILVETAGGTGDIKMLIEKALIAGKDVVTANKALLAEHGAEIFAAARRAGRCIAFEAAVCGGMPIIESIRRGLIANRIDAVMGILNGTCNYILTRMLENNASYKHALLEAQEAGFAETDPKLDVSGIDSAHKLAILASLCMRVNCPLSGISVRGIESIELGDLSAGDELGYRCKLLASARQTAAGLELSVQPTFVPKSHPLAAVSGPYNAVSIYAEPVGHVLMYGRGAGGAATASAVISDLVGVAIGNAGRTFESLAVLPDLTPPAKCISVGETVCSHYIRVGLRDQPGGIGRIATVLGDHGISIATIVQHEPADSPTTQPVRVIVTTHPAAQSAIAQSLQVIAKLDVTLSPCVSIPMMGH